MAKIIRDTGKEQRLIDPDFVLQALGAEDTGIEVDKTQGPISLFFLRQSLVEALRSTGGRPALEGAGDERNKVTFFRNDCDKLRALARYYKEHNNINTSPGQIASIIIHTVLSRMPDISSPSSGT